MNSREFMTGKHQQIIQVMSHQLLKICRSPNWFFSEATLVKECILQPWMWFHMTSLVVDPFEEITTALLAFPAPSPTAPCGAKVHCPLDDSTVWVALLWTRFVIVTAFKTMKKDFLFHVIYLFILKSNNSPDLVLKFSHPSHWIVMTEGR